MIGTKGKRIVSFCTAMMFATGLISDRQIDMFLNTAKSGIASVVTSNDDIKAAAKDEPEVQAFEITFPEGMEVVGEDPREGGKVNAGSSITLKIKDGLFLRGFVYIISESSVMSENGELYTVTVNSDVKVMAEILTFVKGYDATCTEPGMTDHYTNGEVNYADLEGTVLEDIIIPAKWHTAKKVNAKEPTYTEQGYTEHYICTECGKLFADKYGRQPLEESDIVIPIKQSTGIIGDVDNDGEVIITDVLVLQQYIAQWAIEINPFNADFDGDGDITLSDVLLIQQQLAGWS